MKKKQEKIESANHGSMLKDIRFFILPILDQN